MAKTMTVGELMKQLAVFPPELPIFFYDIDKERDSNLEVLELAGPQFDPDDGGNIIPSSPYYSVGYSSDGNCVQFHIEVLPLSANKASVSWRTIVHIQT